MNGEIRPPREAEWPACRMLLPEAFEQGCAPEALLAVANAPPHILGAACFHDVGDALRDVRIRVIRTHRREGIGSRLLGCLRADGARRGARELTVVADTGGDSQAELFLSAHGFCRAGRLTTFEGGLEPLRRLVRGALDPAGPCGDGVSIVRLSDAPRDQVALLYRDYILHDPGLPAAVIRASLDAGKLDDSVVLVARGAVQGAILGRVEGEVWIVYARVVAPLWRGGRASRLLLASGVEKAWGAGARRTRFDTLDTTTDTMKLATRLSAVALRIVDRFTLRIAPGDNHA